MTQVLERDEYTEAVSRSLMYDFIVRSLTYPTPRMLQETEAIVLPGLRKLKPVDLVLADRLAAAVEAAADADLVASRRAHGLLFPPIESQDCPAYETAYRGSEVFQQVQLMADVGGFYLAHGLRPGGSERERPDHITTELAFMQFLTRKEAYALEHLGTERAEQCRATQALFLSDHLGCWAPQMGERMAAIATTPFFAALGSLLSNWVQYEMMALDVEPRELVAEPLPFPPRSSEECGSDGGGCAVGGECRC